jgi:hypothetical protein
MWGLCTVQYGFFSIQFAGVSPLLFLLNPLENSSGGESTYRSFFCYILLHSVYFAFLTLSPITNKLFRILYYKCFGFAISPLSSQGVMWMFQHVISSPRIYFLLSRAQIYICTVFH